MELKTILLTIVALATLNSCCWTDHSKTIKEVAEPMLKELEHFYAKKKRFPRIEERNEMLEKVGCRMDGNFCLYSNKKINLNTWITNFDYKIRMTLDYTYCSFNLYKNNGKVSDIRFYQKPCIDLGQ